MSNFNKAIFTLAVAFPAALAAIAPRATINGGISGSGTTINGDECPNNQVTFANGNDDVKCCPGTIFSEDDEPFCCVGATFEVAKPTFASCFPTCSGSDDGSGVSSTSTQPCSTTIFFSESNYSSLAQAAATSLSSGGSGSSGASATSTSGSSSASNTSDGGSSSSSSSETSTTEDSSSAASQGSESSTSSDSEGAAAMITAAPMAGAIFAAGGMLMAL